DLLLAIEHDLDWRAGPPREIRRGEAPDARAELAAKPSAHVVCDALDLGRRNSESPRECAGYGDCRLRGAPDGQPAVVIPLRHQSVGFGALMRDDRATVRPLDGRVRLIKPRGNAPLGCLLAGVVEVAPQRTGRGLLPGVLDYLIFVHEVIEP